MKIDLGKILVLLSSLFLFSCGKIQGVDGALYTENGKRWKNSDLPVTYKVPRKYYDKYKTQFENVEADYQDAAGKDLVNFTPVDEDPKYNTHSDAHGATGYDKDNMYIYFKDSDSNFTDFESSTLAQAIKSTYSDGTISFSSIVMGVNKPMIKSHFEEVLLHEVGHALGFQHITDSISYMNPTSAWPYFGFQNDDEERVRQKYLLFAFLETYKDLEGMGADKEIIEVETSAENFQAQFGLSEERSFEVAKMVSAFNKVRSKRALTKNDRNIFTKSLLGVDYTSSKKALENHIQGEENALEDILKKASERNGISPEDVQEMVGEYLLK